MATHTYVNPIYWKGTSNSGPLFRGYGGPALTTGGENTTLKETAGQTYRVGDLVYIDSNGTVAIVTESTDTVNSAILGQAAKAATGVTGAPAYVMCWRPEDRYLMQVIHGTAASAVTALTQRGQIYSIKKDESGNDTYHVDIETTTVEDGSIAIARVQVVDFPEGEIINGVLSTIGDLKGWVIVKPLEFSIGSDGDPRVRCLQY
jgi:hypothetical protein